VRPYALAVAASGGSIVLSERLGLLTDAAGFPLLLGAVMLSAWYGGLGPGLLATALGAAADTLVTLPAGHLGRPLVSLGAFVLEALVICALATVLRSAQERAQRLAESEQAARAEVEANARRLHHLQRVTDTALAHLELDDLLRELIDRIREALSADTVVILLLTEDGVELAVRAAHGLEQEVADGIHIPMGRGIAGRIAAQREPMLFEDLARVEVSSPILREKGLRALLGIPLVFERETIGVVHVGSLQARRFSEDEVRMLRLVADRIAVAIGHARLYEAERRARSEAETAERRFRLLVDGVGDYALYMLDADGRVVNWNAGAERLKGYSAAEIVGRHFSVFYTPEDVARGAPAEALSRAAASGLHEEERWRVRRDGLRFWGDVVITALRDDEGRLVGFATLTHDLTERRREAEVRARLLEQVISAQEDEQRRIARELHDATGQSLTSLLVRLRVLEDAAALEEARAGARELRAITARALDEVRQLARGLRPIALDELGLAAALEQQAAEFARVRGIRVEVEVRGVEAGRLPPAVETALYRIVQEALTNAAKHAAAQTVSIVIRRQGPAVQAIVADDGCGFDVKTALGASGSRAGLGLHGMRERAASLSGSVTIESTPGEGTTIYALIPLANFGAVSEDPPDAPPRRRGRSPRSEREDQPWCSGDPERPAWPDRLLPEEGDGEDPGSRRR
jgi:PAS domain S-box-containing protein